MANTPNRQYPYPGVNEAPDGPYAFQRLAEAIDLDVLALPYARGLQFNGKRTDSTSAFSGTTVVHNIPSFAFKAGRRYKITWDLSYLHSVAASYFYIYIATCQTTDGATSTAGLTILNGRTVHTDGAGLTTCAMVTAIYTPAADATLQVKFLGARTAGTGTMTVIGGEPHLYQIEDLGAQALQTI